ncbi:MAG: L,D-transpeptidase [Leptolyngbyaceae cyanobacterium RU_5_1]|nr:L,D-transpeptidase [Leptolyngbyaceae cyanobacterium RU_5_1]
MDVTDPLLRNFGTIGFLVAVTLTALTTEPASPQRNQLVAQRSLVAEAVVDLKRSNQRWLEIDLSSQRLFAWQGRRQVYAVVISTGKDATPTPTGVFAVQTQHRYARMQGEDYDIPDVPYTMYYHHGYAIHGAYWHNSFGTPVSHGCVNVAVNHARWLYYWANISTPVVIHH